MRCEVCWIICVLFRVSVSGTVLHPRSPNYFTGTILATPFTSTVLRPRFQPCSPDSSPKPFFVPVHLLNRIVTLSPLRTLM